MTNGNSIYLALLLPLLFVLAPCEKVGLTGEAQSADLAGRKRTGLLAGQQSYCASMTHWAGNTRKVKLRSLLEIKTPSRQRYLSSNSSTFTSHLTTSFTDPFQCELKQSSKVGTRSLASSDVEQTHLPAMALSKPTNQEPQRRMR